MQLPRVLTAQAMEGQTQPIGIQPKPGEVAMRVDTSQPLHTVPANYTGLSYESAQLAHPLFFTAGNQGLVELVKRLSPAGVLRIGGNTSEYTHWAGEGAAATGAAVAEPPSAGKNTAESYTITAAAIRNLRGFLDATGWRLIYGLNLKNGTAEEAAAEAGFVAQTMGDKLLALQFGNEPDLFHHDDAKHTRWSYEEYATKWLQFEPAVRAAASGAALAGPDIATNWGWVQKFAAQMHDDVRLLTGHYYIGGPPSNPVMNIDALLTPPQHLLDELAVIERLITTSGLPYRMAEGNSCYMGGKPDVSNTFASALWAGDYMLQLAQAGYAGVNLHGGGEGWYTPIATDKAGVSSARPVYFGMLVAQEFAGATMVETALNSLGENVTGYAAVRGRELLVAVFNKSAKKLQLRLDSGWKGNHRAAKMSMLSAPSLDAKQDVKFELTGRVGKDPTVMPRSLLLPPYTGLLLQFGGL
jgi:hypothetical protein